MFHLGYWSGRPLPSDFHFNKTLFESIVALETQSHNHPITGNTLLKTESFQKAIPESMA